MSLTIEEHSQAARLEDVVFAGVEANGKGNFGGSLSGTTPNASIETRFDESDRVVEPKANAAPEDRSSVPPQVPQRSKGVIALIMASLMVRNSKTRKLKCEHC